MHYHAAITGDVENTNYERIVPIQNSLLLNNANENNNHLEENNLSMEQDLNIHDNRSQPALQSIQIREADEHDPSEIVQSNFQLNNVVINPEANENEGGIPLN